MGDLWQNLVSWKAYKKLCQWWGLHIYFFHLVKRKVSIVIITISMVKPYVLFYQGEKPLLFAAFQMQSHSDQMKSRYCWKMLKHTEVSFCKCIYPPPHNIHQLLMGLIVTLTSSFTFKHESSSVTCSDFSRKCINQSLLVQILIGFGYTIWYSRFYILLEPMKWNVNKQTIYQSSE